MAKNPTPAPKPPEKPAGDPPGEERDQKSVAQRENPSPQDERGNPLTAEEGANIGPLTQQEAALVSAVDSKNAGRESAPEREAAMDATVRPKSQTIQNPDAEMRGDLSQDVLTQQRERMRREVKAAAGEGAEPPALDELNKLHDDVMSAQRKVDEAIMERDTARDAYDRALEATNVSQTPEKAISDYVQAQNRVREDAAAEQRARRER